VLEGVVDVKARKEDKSFSVKNRKVVE